MAQDGTPPKKVRKKGACRQTSLRDIAQDLGVSLSLVSKVLSGRLGTTKVREEVKTSILRRAEELNYRPNSLASALQRGRTGTIGLIVHPTGVRGSGLFEEFLRGLTDVLEQQNLRLWLRYFEDNGAFYPQWHKYSAREVDGLIVAGIHHYEMDECLIKLVEEKLPVVTAFALDTVKGIPNVNPNPDDSSYIATKHLIENGCQRIAYIDNFELRKSGYQQALKDHGIAYDAQLVNECSNENAFRPEIGAETVAQLIESGIPFDALIAQSDPMAFAAVMELQSRGLHVPDDVQVIGFDNSPICELCNPKLSSVANNMRLTGEKAMEAIIALIEERPLAQPKLPPSLTQRESTVKKKTR